MKLTKVTKSSQVNLKDISAELVLGDGAVKRIILRDKIGGYLEFSVENYSAHAYVPALPEMKTVWKVSGTLNGIRFSDVYEDRYAAENTYNKFDTTLGVGNLKNEEISVPVEE